MQAFSLDFNLRQHMKIHSKDHYRVCPYPDCGKRYTQECKLKSHIKAHHEKVILLHHNGDYHETVRVFDSHILLSLVALGHFVYL